MDILPLLKVGKLLALYGPEAVRSQSMTLIAELALRGPVTILDGGNRYQPYQVAALLRRRIVDISIAANRLFSRRAFTCYEMTTLLGSVPPVQGSLVVLDLLNTFYDDHVRPGEARRLLDSCLRNLTRLRVSGLVVVTLAPPMAAERAFLLEQVCDAVDLVLTRPLPLPEPVQPALF